MQKKFYSSVVIITIILAGCSTAYKASPVSFKMPHAYDNMVNVAGTNLAAMIYADPSEAEKIFGFDIIGAKMLPVKLTFDNRGTSSLKIDGDQTFLEDLNGNWWPVLSMKMAYERATKYASEKEIIKGGAIKSLWGAAAGTIIGAAIGIVSGENVAEALAKGAAIGAAAAAVLGGAAEYASDDARGEISNDLIGKSFQNKIVDPKSLAFGFLFFPGEAISGKRLRIKLIEENIEENNDTAHVVELNLKHDLHTN